MREQLVQIYDAYMRQHTLPLNRKMHGVFFLLGLGYVTASVVTLNAWYLLLIFPTWILPYAGHRLVEKNRGATVGMIQRHGKFDLPYWILLHIVDAYCLCLFSLELFGLRRIPTAEMSAT